MKNNKKSFTTLELLIVIFIISLISATMIAGLRSGEKQYQVKLAAQEIAQNIRKAQDLALTSKGYVCSGPGAKLPDSYGAYFYTGNKDSYIIFGDCISNQSYQPADMEVETIQIESGIEIDALSIDPGVSIVFSVPDGFVRIMPGDSNSAVITIKKSDIICSQQPESCKKIEVIKTGQINVKNY